MERVGYGGHHHSSAAAAHIVERIWQKNYEPGMPAEIDPDAYSSLVALFEESCKQFAPRPAFHNFGTTLTYAEVEQRSRDFAAYLQAAGFRRGERIALMVLNLLQYPIALFGALRAGLIVVNTNPLYTAHELQHQLNDSGAVAIVVLANFAHVVEEVLPRTALRKVIVTELADLMSFPRNVTVNWIVRYIKRLVPRYSLPDAVKFKDALRKGSTAMLSTVELSGDDVALLQYTGGTTGVAKGVMLTHRNLVANLEQLSASWRSTIRDGEDIIMTPLPLYHVFCFTCNCLLFLKHGGLNVLITNPRDLDSFVSELSKWRFTFISGVNTLFQALLDHPRFSKLDFSKLKFGAAGGMALHAGVAERWNAVTGSPIMEGYGLSEASPVVACNVPSATRIGTVGLPLASTDISIRDDGHELGVGEIGELCVRGPQVMSGYWNMPEETDNALRNGWLHTGDIARVDEDGYLHIVDRKKDMIIVSGFKVFPNEIESVVASHEHVLEVGCVGVPDTKAGQAVKIFVVTRASADVTVEQIRAYCRERLTGYKVPKYVEFRSSLPKTNLGKVLRRALLEEEAGSRHEQLSGRAS